ncbi:MAG: hypothetical protein JXA13_05135 [Anaerolineales bacterium]|nr:hypothetical protein [Anaerolineales bacterium]
MDMTHELGQRELVIDLASGEYQINRIEHRINGVHIIGPVDYGWGQYTRALGIPQGADLPPTGLQGYEPPEVMTWGGGPLAGSRIPGTRRLVFCGYSPSWQGFFVSSLGGGAYIMHRVGVDFVTIKGQAPQDSVLILNHQNGEISARLEPLDVDALWVGQADPDGALLYGYYALQQAIYDRYSREYENDWVRVFCVGPASRRTIEGIIGSNQVKKGRILPIDDWAGRGGLGSRMLQYHHLAGCIFGGDWEDPDLKDSKEINGYFQEYYGQSMIQADLGATEKYRYTPGFQTGGTFGVNMYTAEDKLFSFNYGSIYASDQKRLEQQQNFIAGHYLEQFNKETIEPKNFAHCGEPCSVVCKKYVGIYKKDYEPYHALGPQVGVFDQRAAEKLNHFIDALGIDAIQMGCTIAWVMELVNRGMVPPEDFGLPPAEEMSFEFASESVHFDAAADSARNASYAQRVAEMIVFEAQGEPFRQGMRQAARLLDERYGIRSVDYTVYTAHSSCGYMAPNQYWVPGMLAPMPMMGKYFVYYGVDYVPPRALGRKCVERMVYELFSENSGVCRFHRKWVEAIVDEIIEAHYQFPLDYKAHQFLCSKRIYELEGSQAVFWESERTVDVIWKFLEKWERHGLNDDSLHAWVARFREDKWSAARAFWDEIRAGIEEAYQAGPEAIPDVSAPFQAARLDIMEKKGNSK